MNRKVPFDEAYKEWRNRARRYDTESVVRASLQALRGPVANKLEDLLRAPWQLMLLVKWVCQDKLGEGQLRKAIGLDELNDLRQSLWNFPEKVQLGTRATLPGKLFLRQLINPQIGFQRATSAGFLREAALLARQPTNHTLRALFEKKTGMDISVFMDLALATYGAILDGKSRVTRSWYSPLKATYSEVTIDAFFANVSRTFVELVAFFRALPDANAKVASELYEFPVVSRYPFLRIGEILECWHPAVFFRGMENFVHSVLSEEGKDYMDRFSGMFERHVTEQARTCPAPFLDEDELKYFMPAGVKVPDGLLCFPGCNIFVESKAGLFDESVMTAGHTEVFAQKTKSLRTAVLQARSASANLRRENRAPDSVLEATQDYLLIVTNKEIAASNGISLASMYPLGALDSSIAEAADHLPLERIYVVSVEDFERLVAAAASEQLHMPSFLADCVTADSRAETAVYFFEQHLSRRHVPRCFSHLVTRAIDEASSRIERAFRSDGGLRLQ